MPNDTKKEDNSTPLIKSFSHDFSSIPPAPDHISSQLIRSKIKTSFPLIKPLKKPPIRLKNHDDCITPKKIPRSKKSYSSHHSEHREEEFKINFTQKQKKKVQK